MLRSSGAVGLESAANRVGGREFGRFGRPDMSLSVCLCGLGGARCRYAPSALEDLPSQRIEEKPDHLQVPRGGMSRLAKKWTLAVSAEGLEGRRARLQDQESSRGLVQNHGRCGAAKAKDQRHTHTLSTC
jgi:hypothetical protein